MKCYFWFAMVLVVCAAAFLGGCENESLDKAPNNGVLNEEDQLPDNEPALSDDQTVPETEDDPLADNDPEEADDPIPSEPFSFFVTSLVALQELSGSQEGFGGDLRFGEEGPGAGLRGADKICATIAEKSMPGAGRKTWRAFLSATADENGNQVNAIDRIGEGPWYDRVGRVFAQNKQELFFDRPQGADSAIINDFPNEDGVPNHQPDPTQAAVDNHDFITGSNAQGTLYSATATCKDWTSAEKNVGKPRVGHSWPRYGGPGGGGPGGGNINPANWMSSLDESGCLPGVHITTWDDGPPGFDGKIGSGGGYGGFYCFALEP